MSCDRTAEFFEILQTYDGGGASSDGSSHHSSSPTQSSSSVNGGGGGYIRGKNSIRQATPSEFSQGAADVSFRVQRSATKLEELTRMVQETMEQRAAKGKGRGGGGKGSKGKTSESS